MQEKYDDSYIGHCNEEISCDGCGKQMALLDYYNQDGLCVQCFKRWCEDDL